MSKWLIEQRQRRAGRNLFQERSSRRMAHDQFPFASVCTKHMNSWSCHRPI
jgi:hypothetical protein